MSDSADNTLEEVFLLSIKLAKSVNVVFEISCEDILEVS